MRYSFIRSIISIAFTLACGNSIAQDSLAGSMPGKIVYYNESRKLKKTRPEKLSSNIIFVGYGYCSDCVKQLLSEAGKNNGCMVILDAASYVEFKSFQKKFAGNYSNVKFAYVLRGEGVTVNPFLDEVRSKASKYPVLIKRKNTGVILYQYESIFDSISGALSDPIRKVIEEK